MLDAARQALGLVAGLDPALLQIVALSLAVSLSAALAAAIIGLPLGAMLAVFRERRHGDAGLYVVGSRDVAQP